MELPKYVKVTNKGMITIPADFRKKYHIQDGDRIAIVEDEDGLRLVQVESIENLRKRSISSKNMERIIEDNRKVEIDLEY